jgi:hypothetical protein
MGKYALAYKVPIQQISQLSIGGENIHICGCSRYGFVRIGALSNQKEYALALNSTITKFSPVYSRYPLAVYNFSSRVSRNGECRGCGSFKFTCAPPRASRKHCSVQPTPPRKCPVVATEKRKLTVEERLNMSLDDIITYNSQ